MFATMARDVETILRVREYPVRIKYGPQRFAVEVPHWQVRIERARGPGASDEYGAAPGPRSDDSRPVAQRMVPLDVKLYTRSAAGGATQREEECLIDQLVDAMFDALRVWGSVNKSSISISDGHLMSRDELDAEGLGTGEGYAMRVNVARGIMSLDYRGEGRPTATVGAIGEGVIEVSTDGGKSYETVDGE